MSKDSTSKKSSIWGLGDKETLALLKDGDFSGRWLNLASGDGRYNSMLLQKADTVVASDIDKDALDVLWNSTPLKQQKKLKIKVFDITEDFPFDDNTFDGVFSTGALHLFPRAVLQQIITEINRVLKPGGKVMIDFATDITRISSEGGAIIFKGEPMYSLKDAKRILKRLFKGYTIKMHEAKLSKEEQGADPAYTMTCNFIVLVGQKDS